MPNNQPQRLCAIGIECSPSKGKAVRTLGEGIKLPVINGLGRTDRVDKWWTQPLAMGFALTFALIYTFWRLFLH